MAILRNIQEFEKRKAASPPVGTTMQSQSVMSAAQVNDPSLQKMTWKNTGIVPMPGQGEYRQEALRDMDEATFRKHQGAMNASDYEYWTEQVKANPESTYSIVNQMFASEETPEEKAKRERREQLGEVFNNLGNLIGNAANLYYTHRGGQYIDLNTANEKHRARMQQLKDKQDALDEQRKNIILNAKLGDIQAQRAERAAKAKTDAEAKADDLKFKRDLILKQIENAYKMGQIDAQTAANMKRDAAKAASDKELEAIKQNNRIAAKAAPSYEDLNGNNKKSTFTYGGKEYNKKDLAAMKELAKRLKEDYYAINIPKDSDEYKVKRDDFIKAILDAQKTDAVTSSYELVDSDIYDASDEGATKYFPEDDELEEWE